METDCRMWPARPLHSVSRSSLRSLAAPRQAVARRFLMLPGSVEVIPPTALCFVAAELFASKTRKKCRLRLRRFHAVRCRRAIGLRLSPLGPELAFGRRMPAKPEDWRCRCLTILLDSP